MLCWALASGNKRLPFDQADLQAIFSSPVSTEGARPKPGRGEAAYWLQPLALFSGARMEELGQLRPSDIQNFLMNAAPSQSGTNEH